jgi:hypothetical protein
MTVQEDLLDLARLKEQIAALERVKAEVTGRVVEALEQSGRSTVTAQGVKGTLVKASTVVIDPDKLKGDLTAAMWKRVTKQVLDKEMLEAHVATGDIDPNVVAAASEEKFSKPYIKVSGKLEIPTTPQVARKVRPRKRSTTVGAVSKTK